MSVCLSLYEQLVTLLNQRKTVKMIISVKFFADPTHEFDVYSIKTMYRVLKHKAEVICNYINM